MSDYRIEAATKEEWAERALRAEAENARLRLAIFEAREEEREACAAIAVSRMDYPQLGPMSGPDCMCAKIAADIRARADHSEKSPDAPISGDV